jgi:hypothetical protein
MPDAAGNGAKNQKFCRPLFREEHFNCTKTMLYTLSDMLGISIDQQVADAVWVCTEGGFRAQCGLVEGALMFIVFILQKWQKRIPGDRIVLSVPMNY